MTLLPALQLGLLTCSAGVPAVVWLVAAVRLFEHKTPPSPAKHRTLRKVQKSTSPRPFRVSWILSGRAGIRTLEHLSVLPVFKTGAIDHSATLPNASFTSFCCHVSARSVIARLPLSTYRPLHGTAVVKVARTRSDTNSAAFTLLSIRGRLPQSSGSRASRKAPTEPKKGAAPTSPPRLVELRRRTERSARTSSGRGRVGRGFDAHSDDS